MSIKGTIFKLGAISAVLLTFTAVIFVVFAQLRFDRTTGYSALFENDQTTPTGLEGYLRTRCIKRLTLAGLATDFCVAFSALDAAGLGFDVTVQMDLCRAIDSNGSLDNATNAMRAAGVRLV